MTASPETSVSHRPAHTSTWNRLRVSPSNKSDIESYSPPPVDRNMAAILSIPRMQPHQNIFAHHDRDKDHSPPSQSSSHRNHPYPRRTSSNSQPEQLPRIHLPPPGSGAPLKFSSDPNPRSPAERDFPSISSIQHESSWRASSDRPQIHRIVSGGKSGISLPPLHSISGGGSPSLPPPSLNAGMPPPPFESSPSGSGRHSPRLYPPRPSSAVQAQNPHMRPNYSPYEPQTHGSRLSPGPSSSRLTDYASRQDQLHRRSRGSHSHADHHHQHRAEREQRREDMYESRHHHREPSAHSAHSTVPMPNQGHHPYDMPSPPLRALQTTAIPAMSYGGSYHREGVPLARSRDQSSTSGVSRLLGGMGDEVGMSHVGPTPGQSRRLAHLMSEQKRRESINSGFQALRGALPSSLPTDSKAIILRKAVAHIAHLEAVLRGSGVAYSDSPPSQVPESSWGEPEKDEDEPQVKWEEEN